MTRTLLSWVLAIFAFPIATAWLGRALDLSDQHTVIAAVVALHVIVLAFALYSCQFVARVQGKGD